MANAGINDEGFIYSLLVKEVAAGECKPNFWLSEITV